MLRIPGEIALTSSLEGRFHNRNIHSVDGGMECGESFIVVAKESQQPQKKARSRLCASGEPVHDMN